MLGRYTRIDWIVLGIGLAVALILFAVYSWAGEHLICSLTPDERPNWHYRTKIAPSAEKCWYIGERMKPRNELYWAEAPTRPPWAQGAKPGWEHRE